MRPEKPLDTLIYPGLTALLTACALVALAIGLVGLCELASCALARLFDL